MIIMHRLIVNTGSHEALVRLAAKNDMPAQGWRGTKRAGHNKSIRARDRLPK